MAFRLNDKHKEKPPGKRRRGKRTVAKECLYKHIRARVCQLYPHFNIGETTGKGGDWANLWRRPCRHWKFVPAEHERDPDQDQAKKITPCSLCLAACAKWNLGLRERQGPKELSAERDRMSTGFSGAPTRREDCGPAWSVRGEFRQSDPPPYGGSPPRTRDYLRTRAACVELPILLCDVRPDAAVRDRPVAPKP